MRACEFLTESRSYIALSVAKRAADKNNQKVVRHENGYFECVDKSDPRNEITFNTKRTDLEPTLLAQYKKLKEQKRKFLELKQKVKAGFLYGKEYKDQVKPAKYREIVQGIKGVRRQLRNLPVKYTEVPSVYNQLKKAIDEDVWSLSENNDQIQVLTCPLYQETVKDKKPNVISRLQDFINLKKNNPLQQFGKHDTMLGVKASPYAGLNLRHAHLTSDYSIVYTITGKDPTIVKLFGIFTHDDLGTGQPMKMKNMSNSATKFANQVKWF